MGEQLGRSPRRGLFLEGGEFRHAAVVNWRLNLFAHLAVVVFRLRLWKMASRSR